MGNSRSEVAKIKYNKDNRRVYSTIIYQKINRHENDIYIVSTIGDRLDLLAFDYYEDQTLWWVIAQANNLGKGSLVIEPGIQIRIPHDVEKIYDEYVRINSNR